MEAMRQAQGRLDRLEAAIRVAVPDWSLGKLVIALMAMRGLDMISASTIVAEVGDLSRFRTPRELMAYVGIVPSEDSTGDKVKRGPNTKTGNRWPANQDRTRNGSMLIGNAVTREPCTGARSGEIKSHATAGAEPRQGNSPVLEADRKIDARFQTGKAPDGHTDMREPANNSLLTDVSRLCSYRCTIIVPTTSLAFCGGYRMWRMGIRGHDPTRKWRVHRSSRQTRPDG
jgi:hypothetical protein